MKTVNKYLERLNQSSMTSLHVYSPSDTFSKHLEFYNIVIAGNGIFIVIKNNFGIAISRTDLEYSNTAIPNLEIDDNHLQTFCPKPNIRMFNKILEMFKYISLKIKSELIINLYYDIIGKEFVIDICQQKVSHAEANYDYTEHLEFNDEKRYIRYLQIHSHNYMGADFSTKDNKDEYNSILCFYGVVGRIRSDSKFYDVDMKYRYWNGQEFIEISFDDVFHVDNSRDTIKTSEQAILDKIIEDAKKDKKDSKKPGSLSDEFPDMLSLIPKGDDICEHFGILF